MGENVFHHSESIHHLIQDSSNHTKTFGKWEIYNEIMCGIRASHEIHLYESMKLSLPSMSFAQIWTGVYPLGDEPSKGSHQVPLSH